MSWAMAASMAIPALLGYVQSREDKEEAKKRRKYEAEKTRGSALTGAEGQYVRDPNMWAKPVQGALQGFAFSQQNQNLWNGDSGGSGGGQLHDSEAISSRYGYGPTVDKANAMGGPMGPQRGPTNNIFNQQNPWLRQGY